MTREPMTRPAVAASEFLARGEILAARDEARWGDPKHVAPTLTEAIARLAHDDARGFVFVREDGSERFRSFRAIAEETRRRAADLHARGLRKGDRLAIVVPDPESFVLSFLGAVTAGVIPVPLSPQLSFKNAAAYHDTVAHVVRASGAKHLLVSDATRPFVEPVLARADMGLGALLDVETLGAKELPFEPVPIAPTDIAFLQFTSGSTSRPKGVVVTHRNLAWNSESFMIHGLRRDSSFDKGVSWLPLFHDMGLIGFVIGPLFTDVPVVFLPTASFVRRPRLWLDKIHEHRGTITYAPNFAYQLVTKRLKASELEGLDLSCLRHAGCGAEPIQAKTLRAFAEKLAPAKFDPSAFLPSYGMAEATLAITFVPSKTGLRTDSVDKGALGEGAALAASGEAALELVNCGRPFPEHAIAIVDDQGRSLGDRQVGQILARGPSIAGGYFAEPELSAEAFKPGPDGELWLHTGDLGYTVAGELFVCGRIKDLVIVRGRNVYPSDLEWVVSELPDAARGTVVAFGVEVDGEEQLVFAVEGLSSEAERVRDAIAHAVQASFSLATHDVVVVPPGTLPRTSSGKPQRRKVKDMYLDGSLARARRVHRATLEAENAGLTA